MWGRRRDEQSGIPPENTAQSLEAINKLSPAPDFTSADPNAGKTEATPREIANPGASGSAEQKIQQFWQGKLAAAAFGGMVSLLMRSPAHRHFSLGDLEWLVLPPLALNQVVVAEANLANGQAMPVALLLWARVSLDIDTRLSETPHYPIRLHRNEWQSGDRLWIVDAAGDGKLVPHLIDQLAATRFEGKPFKMLSQEGGKLVTIERVHKESRVNEG